MFLLEAPSPSPLLAGLPPRSRSGEGRGIMPYRFVTEQNAFVLICNQESAKYFLRALSGWILRGDLLADTALFNLIE